MFHRSAGMPTIHQQSRTLAPRSNNVLRSNNENAMPIKSLKASSSSSGNSNSNKGLGPSVTKPGSSSNSTKTPGKSMGTRRRALGDISNKKGNRNQAPLSVKGLSSKSSSSSSIKPLQLIWNDENPASMKKKTPLKSLSKSSGGKLNKKSLGSSSSSSSSGLKSKSNINLKSHTSTQPSKSFTIEPRRKAVGFDIPLKPSTRKPLTMQFPATTTAASSIEQRLALKGISMLDDVEFPAGRTWAQQLENGDLDHDEISLTDSLHDDFGDGAEFADEWDRRLMAQSQAKRDREDREHEEFAAKMRASIELSLKEQDEKELNDLLDGVDEIKLYDDLDLDDDPLMEPKSDGYSDSYSFLDSCLADDDSFLDL